MNSVIIHAAVALLLTSVALSAPASNQLRDIRRENKASKLDDLYMMTFVAVDEESTPSKGKGTQTVDGLYIRDSEAHEVSAREKRDTVGGNERRDQTANLDGLYMMDEAIEDDEPLDPVEQRAAVPDSPYIKHSARDRTVKLDGLYMMRKLSEDEEPSSLAAKIEDDEPAGAGGRKRAVKLDGLYMMGVLAEDDEGSRDSSKKREISDGL